MADYWMILPSNKDNAVVLAEDFSLFGQVHTVYSATEIKDLTNAEGVPFAVVIAVPRYEDDLTKLVTYSRRNFPDTRIYLVGTISPLELGGLDITGAIPYPLPTDWVKGLQQELGMLPEVVPTPHRAAPRPVEVQEPEAREAVGNDQVIVVFSGKGGDGKSTVAAQLALLLSKQGVSTLLIDADYKGNQAEWFRGSNAPPIHSIWDFKNTAPKERTVLESYLMSYKKLKVLACPQTEVGPIPAEVLSRTIDAYKPYYSILILDMHQGFSPELLKATQYANKLVAVTVPSERRLYPFAVTLTQLLNHGISRKKLHVVINRTHTKDAESKVRVALHDVMGDSYSQKYHMLPFSESLSFDDDPEFYPIMDLKSNDPYVTAFYKMAESVTGLKLRSGKSTSAKAPKPAGGTSAKVPAKSKKSGGFLGLFGGKKGAKNNAKKR